MGGFGRVSLPARFGYFAAQQSNARRGSGKPAVAQMSRHERQASGSANAAA